ncbi:hypothetical protein ACVIHH_008287 [Bradyrhizobium sp. USDA 4518]
MTWSTTGRLWIHDRAESGGRVRAIPDQGRQRQHQEHPAPFSVRTDHCTTEIKTIEDLLNSKLRVRFAGKSRLRIQGPLMLALTRGGSEFNLDPDWKFLKDQVHAARATTYLPDWTYTATQLDGWVKKFEQDIAPKM